jgi:hypothetical protein
MIFENDSVRDLADVALMERAYLLFLIDNMVPDMTMQEMKDPDVHEMQLSRLTPVQRSHFETITKAVLEGPGDGKNIFFLNAPAGSGKTFVTELMVQALRFKGRLVIPVASTGIAALLLEKGMNAHKCFSIPLQQEHSCSPSVSVACNPRPQMMDAFQDCDIIFWDEITMSPLSIISGVDNLMRRPKEFQTSLLVGGWLSFLGILGTACLLLSGEHHLLNDNAKSVECIILNGVRAGKKALFHRIDFHHDFEDSCPIDFVCRQFPLRLCFAMIINKSQGQAFSGRVGTYLKKDVFAHGHLYVPLSRATSPRNIYLCHPPMAGRGQQELKNIVAPDVTARLRCNDAAADSSTPIEH